MVKTVKVPPDGGYGWIIVLAAALSNVVLIPLMQNFGLIFKDRFEALGLSGTQCSLIININSALAMLLGLVNGVLLKLYGYRKTAFVAAFLVTLGMILTAYSTTFVHFIVSYGIVTSIGMGLGMSAFSLALNSYFKEKRNKAVGFCMTLTGLGPIIMPQVMTLLMKHYNIQGVTLILAGIASHAFVSAALLQPIKWHTIVKEIDEEAKLENDEEDDDFMQSPDEEVSSNMNGLKKRRKDSTMGSTLTIDYEVEAGNMYGLDSTLGGSVMSLQSHSRRPSTISRSWKKNSNLNLEKQKDNHDNEVYNPELSKPLEEKQKPFFKRIWNNMANVFDLDLLKDPIYVNIMLGMSFAVFAELNFSVLTPFILADLGLNIDQAATFLSVLGVADIIFRFFAPYIGDYLNKPARPMYLITLLLLISTRFTLLLSGNFYIMISIALGLGVAKGVRTVYMSLVIPTYVPLEKLPSASGIQMMVNGVCVLIGGPLLGVVRDFTGSYTMCIVIMNCVTFTTVLMWTVEGIIVKSRQRLSQSDTKVPKEQQITLLNK